MRRGRKRGRPAARSETSARVGVRSTDAARKTSTRRRSVGSTRRYTRFVDTSRSISFVVDGGGISMNSAISLIA